MQQSGTSRTRQDFELNLSVWKSLKGLKVEAILYWWNLKATKATIKPKFSSTTCEID